MSKRLFMVAGEASADMHAATLLIELKKLNPDLHCLGVGGPMLRGLGMETILDSERLNVVGISDWLDRASEVLGGYRKVINSLKSNPPDYAVLIDLPDFNLRVAKHLKRLGVPVVYYISPQVWAWRKYRIKQIKRDVDLMLVVFPFEKEFYAREGLNVEFVGHPLLESIRGRESFRSQSEIFNSPRIALLPGSRKSEVRFHGPILKELAAEIIQKYPGAEFRVPVATTLSDVFVKQYMDSKCLNFQSGNSHEVLGWADIAVVASGTATLETALVGTPFTLFYKVSKTSAWLYRNLMSYRGFIGMPNLLLQTEVVKEYFQDLANPKTLYSEVDHLIQDENYRTTQASLLVKCRNLLGDRGANQRAAQSIDTFWRKLRQNKQERPA